MTSKAKERIQEAFDNAERNFQQLLRNEDVKKILADMKKLKSTRAKEIDGLLNGSLDDIRKGYASELRGLKKLVTKERKRLKQFFQAQLTEIKKIRVAVEDHITSDRGRKRRKVVKAKK